MATDFERELAALINKCSEENGSNTPDFILADYLSECLGVFNAAVVRRDQWYGVELRPGASRLAPLAMVEDRTAAQLEADGDAVPTEHPELGALAARGKP